MDFSLFSRLPSIFRSVELLINLNSFGFIREACRVMNAAFREVEDDIMSDLDEYDNSLIQSVEELNIVAGGDYWQQLIRQYKTEEMDCYQTEKEFAKQYKQHLRQSFDFVLDMPIRLKAGQHPKYRMVHATNHPDGCLLMANNMAKRTDHLVVEIQNRGQMTFFQETADNQIISDEELMEKMDLLISGLEKPIRLNHLLALFFDKYGVLCSSNRLSSGKSGSVLKKMESSGRIDVIRSPQLTKTGKPALFWTEKSETQTVTILRK